MEAKSAIATARKILAELGVVLHAEKSRIVHVRQGFEFLGYKIPPEALPENVEAMRLFWNMAKTEHSFDVITAVAGTNHRFRMAQ